MSNFKKTKMVRIQNSLSFDMVKIEAGSFQMGTSVRDREKPIHKVTIDYDFELGKYPVTVGEYLHFVKATKKEKLDEWTNEKENHPITDVSWNDAVEFCNWLNEQQKEYVYRLPTEAEWEYVCRAGTDTRWSFGDDENKLKYYAWYNKNSYDLGEEHEDYGTNKVGQKLDNPWELYDMHGNVWEWCKDDWAENYNETPIDGSANHSQKEKEKSLRGGSWGFSAFDARSANRDWYSPADRSDYVGFRLLRTLP